jgi:hypothetical protein
LQDIANGGSNVYRKGKRVIQQVTEGNIKAKKKMKPEACRTRSGLSATWMLVSWLKTNVELGEQ